MHFIIIPVVAIVALLILAKAGARWLASRRDMSDSDFDPSVNRTLDFSTETDEATKREEKEKMVREQVASKVRWGASEREVREWLEQRQGITGSEADELLTRALGGKQKSTRLKALIGLALSGLAGTFIARYLMFRIRFDENWFDVRSQLMLIAGFVALVVFLQCLWMLLTGKSDGAVD